MRNEKTEKRICLVQFVDFFSLSLVFFFAFSRIFFRTLFPTKSTKATSKNVRMYGSLWESASAEVNNREYMPNQRYHHRLTNDVGILYLFCNNHKPYKILLTRWTFSFFCRSSMLNAHNLSHQHQNGTRHSTQRAHPSSIRFIPKIKSESFHFHVLGMDLFLCSILCTRCTQQQQISAILLVTFFIPFNIINFDPNIIVMMDGLINWEESVKKTLLFCYPFVKLI